MATWQRIAERAEAEIKDLKQQLKEATKSAYTDCPICGCETAGTNELAINKEIHILRQQLAEQVAYGEVAHTIIKKGVTVLREHILPDSGLSDEEAINQLYGVLDNKNVVTVLDRQPQLLKQIQADAVRQCAIAIYPKDSEIPEGQLEQFDLAIKEYANQLESE